MKILCLNCKPDLTYFSKRGLVFDVEYKTYSQVFPLKLMPFTTGILKNQYAPNPTDFLNTNYNSNYDFILVGYDIKDYPTTQNLGGYTYADCLLPSKTFYSVVRNDGHNNYFIHELHHLLVNKLHYTESKTYLTVKDYMDTDSQGRPFYLNEEPENPLSNYSQTWNQIKPYLSILNNTMNTYKYFSAKEVVGLKPELVSLLDKMRGECGFPFKINSGLRTVAQNSQLKDAVSDSAHLSGEAVDIAITDSTQRMKIISSAFMNGIKRVGIAKDFIHLDISKTLPQGVIWLY